MGPKQYVHTDLLYHPYNEWGFLFLTQERFLKTYSSYFVLWYLPTYPKRGRYEKTIFDHVAIVTGHRQSREQKFEDECNMQLCPDSVSLYKLCSPLKSKCSLVLDN